MRTPQTQAEKHIHFVERDPLPKTKRWDVVNTRTKMTVGEIQWYGGWRKYVFFPEDDHFFDHHCLRLIADFTEQQTRAQLRGKRLLPSEVDV